MKTEQNKNKSLCLRIPSEIYNNISQQAQDMNISMNSYITKQLLNGTGGHSIQFDRIMQLMPRLYGLIDQVEDSPTRNKLKELGGKICQCLK